MLYKPERVFTFDEKKENPQESSVMSAAVCTAHSGYGNRNDSYIREVSGNLVEETTEVIDDYTQRLLHRIKKAIPLNEMEYGMLLKTIECGELKSVHEVLENSLLS